MSNCNGHDEGCACTQWECQTYVGCAKVERLTETQWQPIETAPKDGTRILAYDGEDCYVVEWQTQKWFAPDGHWVYGTSAQNSWNDELSTGCSHWMPLPEPPKEP